MSYSALGLASLTILPSWRLPDGTKVAPSDRIVLGFVGLGQQGRSDFRSFSSCPGVQVAACCDVDSIKRERFRLDVTKWQKDNGMNERCDMYEFYEDLLDRKDIVNNMHEAYKRIQFNDYGYGTFISGPSKTADIAQVLVMGAQAARSATVVLV